jgi:CMP-N-acetylneuraminic acid synthetase
LGEKIAGAASHKQNLPKLYIPNGMAYAVRADRLRADRQLFPEPLVCVPNDEHGRNVDVDEEIDIAIGDAAARTYGFRPFG